MREYPVPIVVMNDVVVTDLSHRVIERHVPWLDAFIRSANDFSYHH